jgi:hypothetical protein
MRVSTALVSCARRVACVVFIALSVAGVANAQVYDLNRFLSGGGGGQDPQKRRIAQSMGAYICLHVAPGMRANTVNFTILSKVPQANSRINTVVFDMGRHASLFQGVGVALASPGVKGNVVAPQLHPFLRGMTPDFWIDVPQSGHHRPEGLSPGRLIVISATLGPGKTITDVFNALHEGLHPTTGMNGLRVGVMVLYLLGGPPPGVATIQDDGGFVIAGPSAACR